MSIEAILDTIIHVDKFKTFDMLSQGTYRLKMRLYHIQDQQVRDPNSIKLTQKKIYAQPYLSPEKRYSFKKIQPQHKAQIIENEQAFATQMFYIKFCDQEFDINEMCVFR